MGKNAVADVHRIAALECLSPISSFVLYSLYALLFLYP